MEEVCSLRTALWSTLPFGLSAIHKGILLITVVFYSALGFSRSNTLEKQIYLGLWGAMTWFASAPFKWCLKLHKFPQKWKKEVTN